MTDMASDPRLTAYALGELDPREAAILEAELGESPDGQRALAEIRHMAELLGTALAGERVLALSDAERAKIISAVGTSSAAHADLSGARAPLQRQSPRRFGRLRRNPVAIFAAAALVLVAAGFVLPRLHSNYLEQLAWRESSSSTTGGVQAETMQSSVADGGTRTSNDPASGWYGSASPQTAGAVPVPADAPRSDGQAVLASEKPADGRNVDLYLGKKVEMLADKLHDQPAGARQAPAFVTTKDTRGRLGIVRQEIDNSSPVQLMVTPRLIVEPEEEEILPAQRFRLAITDLANTEAYDAIVENAFLSPLQQPLSTFSIDVDTAAYANVRRFLQQNQLPPRGAVRIEELLNYFPYDYAPPQTAEPFAVHTTVADCPWAAEHRLVRIALKGREIAVENRPTSNLVFLVDVSGSMRDENKLPLVKEGLRMLVERLGENDRVAMAIYAGGSGIVLPSTLGSDKRAILQAIDQLQPSGSTNGAAGINLAYETAVKNFITGGANRVILATDGDFNVGITDQSQLIDLIEKKAASGVFLSVLGFGMGNYKDSTLEKLADKGNGNYAYIDNAREARKVLVEQLSGTLVTIAKDVKIQIEFNPARVQSYRLIGYENRVLAKEDFNNDQKDAGEIGAGHTVTALYEVVPAGAAATGAGTGDVDKLEYQSAPAPAAAAQSTDLLTLKLRYKEPAAQESRLLKFPVEDRRQTMSEAGRDFEFAAAVAAFGMLLRDSAHRGSANFGMVLELAEAGRGEDAQGYRREFIELTKKARDLRP